MNIIPLGSGKCSSFGGMADSRVGNLEGLSLIEGTDLNDWWFRRLFVIGAGAWDSSKGLAKNLNPDALYCAMRWGFASFGGVQGEVLSGYSREQVRRAIIIVEARGNRFYGQGADWGPNTDTGRLIDLSPGWCKRLGVSTDDIVTVSALI